MKITQRNGGLCSVSAKVSNLIYSNKYQGLVASFLTWVHVEMVIPSKSPLGNTGSEHYLMKKWRMSANRSGLCIIPVSFSPLQSTKFHVWVHGGSWSHLAHGGFASTGVTSCFPPPCGKKGDQAPKHSTRVQQMLVLRSVGTCYVSCVTPLLLMCGVRVRALCHLWRILQTP